VVVLVVAVVVVLVLIDPCIHKTTRPTAMMAPIILRMPGRSAQTEPFIRRMNPFIHEGPFIRRMGPFICRMEPVRQEDGS
jgi:hypothetical protein